MREYENVHTRKQKEDLKKLTANQAILKAVADSSIDLEGLKPDEVYEAVLDRIERSQDVINEKAFARS